MQWDVCIHSKKELAGCKPSFTLYEVTYLLCVWNKYLSSIWAGWQNYLNKQLHIELLNLIIHFLLCIMVGIHSIHSVKETGSVCEKLHVKAHVWHTKCFSQSQNHPKVLTRQRDKQILNSFLTSLIIAGHHLVKHGHLKDVKKRSNQIQSSPLGETLS